MVGEKIQNIFTAGEQALLMFNSIGFYKSRTFLLRGSYGGTNTQIEEKNKFLYFKGIIILRYCVLPYLKFKQLKFKFITLVAKLI